MWALISRCAPRTVLSVPRVQDECGERVTSLCPYGNSGCPDSQGDYDIIMPEPMAGTEAEPVFKVGYFSTSGIDLP